MSFLADSALILLLALGGCEKIWPYNQASGRDAGADTLPRDGGNDTRSALLDATHEGVLMPRDSAMAEADLAARDAAHDSLAAPKDSSVSDATPEQSDVDGDKVPDVSDNCPTIANPEQSNIDGDSAGDLCDPDMDGDTIPNDMDPRETISDALLYFGPLSSAGADFTSPTPTSWQTSGAGLCHPADAAGTSVSVLQETRLPGASDYTVETGFTVNSVGVPPISSDWASAGLVVRVTALGTNQQQFYQCVVDLTNRRLMLGWQDRQWWHTLASSDNNSVLDADSYRIRFTAKGSQLTCALVSGPLLTWSDTNAVSGTVGVTTYYSSACFQYLVVTPPPS